MTNPDFSPEVYRELKRNPSWIKSPWLKSQIAQHLTNLGSWVCRYGYKFTEKEAACLRAVLEEGTKDETINSDKD